MGAVDADRAGAVRTQLESVPEGRALLSNAALDVARICFADDGPGVLVHGGTPAVVLSRRADANENAARLGHLLRHRLDGPPLSIMGGAGDCDARVLAALTAEARGHAVEIRLRRALGVHSLGTVLPFEAALRSVSPAEQTRGILDFLLRNPNGTRSVPPFGADFRRGCRE